MKRILLMVALLSACAHGAEIRLSDKELASVGRRVWQNESGGTVAGLTAWNKGENFASLGIGHFIWYPKGVNGPFDESFPKLLVFMEKRGVRLPSWLDAKMDCPWQTRAAFEAERNSPRMKELRELLANTIPHQAAFLAQRLREALPKMLDAAPAGQRDNVRRQFERMTQTAAGVFALIDYVNFKGEGVLASERYKGEGWGLLQVLAGMSGSGPEAPREFSESAKEVLTRRVRNSPPERNEARWLPGWTNRVESYKR